jgi:hypothetical protein
LVAKELSAEEGRRSREWEECGPLKEFLTAEIAEEIRRGRREKQSHPRERGIG